MHDLKPGDECEALGDNGTWYKRKYVGPAADGGGFAQDRDDSHVAYRYSKIRPITKPKRTRHFVASTMSVIQNDGEYLMVPTITHPDGRVELDESEVVRRGAMELLEKFRDDLSEHKRHASRCASGGVNPDKWSGYEDGVRYAISCIDARLAELRKETT